MSEHIPYFATAHGECYGACSCGWDATRGYAGDIAWREKEAMRDATEHANENGEQK